MITSKCFRSDSQKTTVKSKPLGGYQLPKVRRKNLGRDAIRRSFEADCQLSSKSTRAKLSCNNVGKSLVRKLLHLQLDSVSPPSVAPFVAPLQSVWLQFPRYFSFSEPHDPSSPIYASQCWAGDSPLLVLSRLSPCLQSLGRSDNQLQLVEKQVTVMRI